MDDTDDHGWLKEGSTSSGEVAKTYDDWAASYEQTLADWDYRAPADAAQLLRPRVSADAAILDAGCGTGLTGMALRRPGGTILISQRDDLFAERGFGATVSALAGTGVFADAAISEPKPYLPANPDFASDIQVIYATMTVAN